MQLMKLFGEQYLTALNKVRSKPSNEGIQHCSPPLRFFGSAGELWTGIKKYTSCSLELRESGAILEM